MAFLLVALVQACSSGPAALHWPPVAIGTDGRCCRAIFQCEALSPIYCVQPTTYLTSSRSISPRSPVRAGRDLRSITGRIRRLARGMRYRNDRVTVPLGSGAGWALDLKTRRARTSSEAALQRIDSSFWVFSVQAKGRPSFSWHHRRLRLAAGNE